MTTYQDIACCLLDELDRTENLCDDLNMVRAADIARRCGVKPWTVSRWKDRPKWNGTRRVHTGCPPPAPLVVADVEFWSWPLLRLYDPNRFPPHQPQTTDQPPPPSDVDEASGS